MGKLSFFLLFVFFFQSRDFSGILKRLMVAVKDQVFLSDLIPKAFALMKVLLDSNFTGESIRSVCTFLVSTLPKGAYHIYYYTKLFITISLKDTEIKQKACGNTNPFSDIPRIITNSKLEDTPSHTIHIRNGLLEMLFDILCGSSSNSKTKIFLSNITTRWIMLFFDRNIHPHTAVLASRILARLMYDQDVMYTERMKEGFVVLSNLLCSYSHIHQIYHSLFAILCGVDVSLVSIDSKLDLPTLTSLFGPDSSSKKRSMCPDVLIVILRMLKQSMSHLVLVNEKCISDPPPAAATSSATTTDTNIASSSNLPLENSTGKNKEHIICFNNAKCLTLPTKRICKLQVNSRGSDNYCTLFINMLQEFGRY